MGSAVNKCEFKLCGIAPKVLKALLNSIGKAFSSAMPQFVGNWNCGIIPATLKGWRIVTILISIINSIDELKIAVISPTFANNFEIVIFSNTRGRAYFFILHREFDKCNWNSFHSKGDFLKGTDKHRCFFATNPRDGTGCN